MDRRSFIIAAGSALGSGLAKPSASLGKDRAGRAAAAMQTPPSWSAVRAQFNLAPDRVHLAAFFLASHPRPVRLAIERHRRGFDLDPFGYWDENVDPCEEAVLKAAKEYLGADPEEISLTDSTTMGLGILYGGLRLRAGQQILTTEHDHYATHTSLDLRARRDGATVRRIPLYEDPEKASANEMADRLVRAVTPKTRLVAVTWVHSVSGVKLPIRQIADMLAKVNASRDEADRVLLGVDGVHGFAAEETDVKRLGCDFLVAGCHKWLFGPRGTGIVWGKAAAWPNAYPTIPTFDGRSYDIWTHEAPEAPVPMAAQMTPGGFHSFEHRWALEEAFRFHQSLGKSRVAARIHELNRSFKEGLRGIRNVRLRTPLSDEVSSGISCFEVGGLKPDDVVDRLAKKKIVATVTPYAIKYARASFSVINSPQDVEVTLRALREIAGA
jgi:selenocysteine lyase/cysteine desulfurase